MMTKSPQKQTNWSWLLLGAVLWVPYSGLAESNQSPREFIKVTTEQLISALQVSRDEIRRRPELARQLADDIVLPYVDFSAISRGVLGKHWRRASPEQRKKFTREFKEFLTNAYVAAMVTYVDDIVSLADDIRYPPVRWRPGQTHASVRTLLRLKNGSQAEVVYRMRFKEGRWRIRDVTILGVSFTLTYRTGFSRDIQQGGLDNLIERLAVRNRQNSLDARVASEAESGDMGIPFQGGQP